MIRHVLLIRWNPEFPAEGRQEWADGVRELPAKIDLIRSMSVGVDVLDGPRSWDHGLVADFETIEDVKAHATHPDHLPLYDISLPNAAEMASLDFEIPDRA